MSITDYIINNFKDSSKDELKESIVASIDSNDEIVLPGLGVLFEILWKNYSNQDEILDILLNNIKTKEN